MKRSKSVMTQKRNKQLKSARGKSKHKYLQAQNQCEQISAQNEPKTERADISHKSIKQRVKKIQLGFQSLQKNLKWNGVNEASEVQAPLTSQLTRKKPSKKLFVQNSEKKTAQKLKGNNKLTYRKLMNPLSPMKLTPKNSKYHTCLYERSLYDLMKIVVMQRDEIQRLNIQIKINKTKR